MKFNKWLIFVFLCLFTVTVSAQKTWEKPLTKWSVEDAQRILSDSPWAKTYQSTQGSSSAAASQVSREQGQSVYGGGSNPRSIARNFGPPPVIIRLHSALPIRQAIVRLQQIQAGYDKMSEAQRAQFDVNAKSFLECGICQKYYVITITKFRDSSGQSIDEGVFQRMELKDLKGNVMLVNEAGVERELVQFTPPKNGGDSAVFFFARKDENGNDFLNADSKDFKFMFKNDFLTTSNPYAGLVPRNFEFKVSKMMLSDKLEF